MTYNSNNNSQHQSTIHPLLLTNDPINASGNSSDPNPSPPSHPVIATTTTTTTTTGNTHQPIQTNRHLSSTSDPSQPNFSTRPISHRSSTSSSSLTTATTTATTTADSRSTTDSLLIQNLRAQTQELSIEHNRNNPAWSLIQSISSNLNPIINQTVRSINLNCLSDRTRVLLILPNQSNNNLSSNINQNNLLTNHLLITHPSPSSGSDPIRPILNNQGDGSFTNDVELCFTSLSGIKGLIQADRIVFTSVSRPINLDLIRQGEIDLIGPSTSLSNELTSPAKFRFPSYQLSLSKPRTLTIPRLSVNHNSSINLFTSATAATTSNSTSTPSNSLSNRSTATQRLASLFGASSNQIERPEDRDPITLSIQTVDRTFDPAELNLSTRRTIENRIRDGLGSLEEAVLVRIIGFVLKLFPQDPQNHLDEDQVSTEIQQLYQSIDHELELEYSPEQNEEGEDQTDVDSQMTKRIVIDHTLELIEEVICLELYDRLFEEIGFEEDLKLTEKIAELNLIEATLDQLGLDLERREMDDPDGIHTIRTGLEDIISLASRELSKLQDEECKCPRDKVGVYVTVHKLIVDGLSLLPSIPMKKEDSAFGASSSATPSEHLPYIEVEMSDKVDSSSFEINKVPPADMPKSSPHRKLDITKPSPSEILDAIQTDLIDPPKVPHPIPSSEPLKAPQTRQPPPRPRPNSSSADLILPILIYLLIKANPPGMMSNLVFVDRYRYRRLVRGETDYCLVNFNVACEFIKNFNHSISFAGENISSASETRPTRIQTNSSQAHALPRVNHRSASGKTSGYGTFTGLGQQSIGLREKTGNEVEEAFMAASRAVSGALIGGYQKVISGSILDAPAARLRSASGASTGTPRTLEDVKRLIGSASDGIKREGGLAGWSNRVGILRKVSNARGITGETESSDVFGSSNSSAAKRLTSLFQNNSSGSNQTEDRKSMLGNRLSSLPGLSRLQSPSLARVS
ncbi:hypothetical protein BY996DRAFT_4579683 [Phakopsora pachyrhizi]|uniref:VPS9 domain-containing protein n=1 Tax=Phakopsora pachyrhizi TaxID=170000 RepID=A0AAV0BRF9_PHAPC|nr:hypothetical protein BY996DRAFT_4579683 [Phakopsora pachyrhizi]CAH7688794.1 hypothetical protein PPACK8108_LOCUS23815 [Phakopsora pachyrhizi]